MCSMSLTVVVSARSNGVMMRPAIWSGGRPWYCQATPMMGMLMLGKISTGMRSAASVPMQENEQRRHDERVGPAQRDTDYGEHVGTGKRLGF